MEISTVIIIMTILYLGYTAIDMLWIFYRFLMKKEEENEYIDNRMEFFAKNIEDFEIETLVLKKSNKSIGVVVDKTINSICVSMKAKSKEGVDCTQWFTMDEFNRKYEKLTQ